MRFLLIQVEAFFPGGGQKPLTQNFFGLVLGQFQVVDASVDRGVAALAGVHFAHHRQPGVEVGEAARRQRRAPCRELKERLTLFPVHGHQHVHESQETGTANQLQIKY